MCFQTCPCPIIPTFKVFEMYQGYAYHHGWSFDILEHMTSDLGQ